QFFSSSPPASYPDIQQGRFLGMGHKVPHIYGRPGVVDDGSGNPSPNLQDYPPPYVVAPANPDTRFPYPGTPPILPGVWRGAFGPHGLNEGLVVYRSPSKGVSHLRMQMITGTYGEPFVVVEIKEYGPPPTPTGTPTNTRTFTPTNTPTPSNTRTFTPTNTASNTPTFTATLPATNTPTTTNTFTPSNTRTPSNTPSISPTRTASFTPSQTNTPSITPTRTNTFTPSNTRTPTNTFTPSRTFTPANKRCDT